MENVHTLAYGGLRPHIGHYAPGVGWGVMWGL